MPTKWGQFWWTIFTKPVLFFWLVPLLAFLIWVPTNFHPPHNFPPPRTITKEDPNFQDLAWIGPAGSEKLGSYAGGRHWNLADDHLCRTTRHHGVRSYFRIVHGSPCGSGRLVFKAPDGTGPAGCPGTSWYDPRVSPDPKVVPGFWMRMVQGCNAPDAQYCPHPGSGCNHGGWRRIEGNLTGETLARAEASIEQFNRNGGWGMIVTPEVTPVCTVRFFPDDCPKDP